MPLAAELSVLAKAKLNLFLHLTGKRPDGYHELLTQVIFTEFGDVLHFAASDLLTLHVTGEFAGDCDTGADNLVLRAARLLLEAAGMQLGAQITLEKNIPVGAGLGGGSADAAATLKALNEFWHLDVPGETLLALAVELGADVPMCLYSEPLFASGIGEELAMLDTDMPLMPIWLVLVYPRAPLLTASVFGALTTAEIERGQFALSHGYGEPLIHTRNDLEAAAIRVAPVVGEVLAAMRQVGPEPLLVRMTGSGACCFALFSREDEAQNYADAMAKAHPDWWVMPTESVVQG